MNLSLIKSNTGIAACITLLAFTTFGQDLGSSNKLFGGSKPSTSSTKKIVKKTAPKPKVTVSKAKPAPAKTKALAKKVSTPVKSSTSKKATDQVTSGVKFTQFKEAQPTVLTITPANTKPEPVPVSSAAEEEFENLIDSGNSARDDRNYNNAELAYKKARSIKSKDSRAVYGLGNLYSDQQRWEEAEAAYRNALQIEPGSAIAHIALSYVLTQQIFVPNLSDRYQEAEKLARRAIQYAPSNALAYDQLGVAMELRGLIGSETEDAYRKAIQLDSSFAPPYAHLGRLLRRRGMTQESADAYRSALERANDAATMVLIADVMQSEQKFAESEKLLKKAISADPKNQAALLMLGRALTTQGKFGDAEKVLKDSLDTAPNTFMANSLIGTLYLRQGKFELAENALLQALRFVTTLEKRNLSQQFESVGDGYMRIGKQKNAERSYLQAISLDAGRESLNSKLAKAQKG